MLSLINNPKFLKFFYKDRQERVIYRKFIKHIKSHCSLNNTNKNKIDLVDIHSASIVENNKKKTFYLNISAKPGSNQTKIAQMDDNKIRVFLQSEAIKNKANEELLQYISNIFDHTLMINSSSIISGRMSRNKIIKIIMKNESDLSIDDIRQILKKEIY